MARNRNTVESLVPISAVAMRLGYTDEMVANRLKASDIHPDWDGTACVSWSVAKATLETLAAEKAAHERKENARRAKQMDDEQEGRMAPVRAYEAAQRRAERRPAMQVTAPPPASESEGWAE